MEIAAFAIALVLVIAAALVGWQRLPIVWRRPKDEDEAPDPGSGER